MPDTDQEKTESPTPRRRQEARQDGNVARSADLSAACILLASILLLDWYGLQLLGGLKVVVEAMLSSAHAANPTRPGDIGALGGFTGRVVFGAVAPMVLGTMAVALLATVAQVGFIVTVKPLQPNIAKLSPLKGLKGLFDARAGMRLLMSLGKVAVIAGIAIISISGDMPRIMMLSELEAMQLFGSACEVVYGLALKLAAGLLILALIDYSFQKWQRERDLKMTKQEVKEELKRMEGDPLVKQRRTRVARQLALQRINHSVPHADVVVTNPTHFAVALQYDSKTMVAPKVVAKGADLIAMRIRQVAISHEIPIIERKELARALFKNVEVGQQIPPQFFSAVAEILAYVYRLSGRKTA